MSYNLVVDGVETKVTINEKTLKFESKDNVDGKYTSVYLIYSSSLAEYKFCSFLRFLQNKLKWTIKHCLYVCRPAYMT
jgi:hypothetical protein